jgi:hypothetical protein
MGTEKKRKEEM